MWHRIWVDDLKYHKRWCESVVASVAENVINKRGEISISVQSCRSVNALSLTKRRHNIQEVD